MKLTGKEKVSYGLGAVGKDMVYMLSASYILYYYQDILGVSAFAMGVILLAARVFDAFNDPIMGVVVAKTRTRWGKFRPWLFIGTILNAIMLYLMFSAPPALDGGGLVAYAAVTYVLWGVTYTMMDIPYWSMIPSFATEEKDRNFISTVARTFSGLGQGIVLILTAPIVAYLGGSSESSLKAMTPECLRTGFGKWSIIAAVMLVVFACISVASTKERNVIQSGEKFSFKQAINVVKNNDQLLTFMLFAMISNAGYYMTSGISSYYFNSVAGDLNLQSKFNMFGAVGSVIGIAVIPICSKLNMNNRNIYKLSLGMAAVGYIGMAVIGYGFGGNVYGLGACYLITSIGIGSMFVNQTVMLADVVDYGEYKLGKRNQSLTFSMKGFLQKMAYTVQCIIMYLTFSITKYEGTAPEQTQEAKDAISALMFIVPPVLIIISFIVFSKRYKIYGDFKREILATVSLRHEEASK